MVEGVGLKVWGVFGLASGVRASRDDSVGSKFELWLRVPEAPGCAARPWDAGLKINSRPEAFVVFGVLESRGPVK